MMAKSRLGLWVIALALAVSAVGCPCTDTVVNSSPWLRWFVFANFGASRVCEEMTKRGALVSVPVPVPGFGNAVGRFYPQSCQSKTNDDTKTLTIWMSGDGYAWTPATQKMSFECSVAIEYKPDFHVDGGTVTVWFDPVNAPPPQFRITYVEQPATNLALHLPTVDWFVQNLAQSFVQQQLGKGFTVIQQDAGEDFGFGHLPVGQRPVHPWNVTGSDRYTFANEQTEIHGQQQDFLGPYEIDDDDRALYLKMQVTGAPVDIFIVSRDVGLLWRQQYQKMSPPPGPPQGATIIQQAQTPATGLFDGWVPLPRGSYYVIIDNSTGVGQARPPVKLPTPIDPGMSQAVQISYLVQVGDRP